MKLLPIDTSAHRTHGWRPPANLLFASGQSLVPVVLEEIPTAEGHFPLAFARAGNADWHIVALMGLHPGHNDCIDTQGRWRNAYVPSALRAYPFALAPQPGQDAKALLCIDTDSGCYQPAPDTQQGDQRFFDDEGKPQALVQRLVAFLQARLANQRLTQHAVQALVQADVLVPWALPDSLKTQPGQALQSNLYRVDEARLNQLDASAWQALRQARAVPLAYAQLFSMARTAVLQALAQRQQKAPPATPADPTIVQKLFDAGQGDTIKFNW